MDIKFVFENSEEKNYENDAIFIKGRKFYLQKNDHDPFKIQYILYDKNLDPYDAINKIIENNLLFNAIWVEKESKMEKIADEITYLEKTNITTRSGYYIYIKYNIKN